MAVLVNYLAHYDASFWENSDAPAWNYGKAFIARDLADAKAQMFDIARRFERNHGNYMTEKHFKWTKQRGQHVLLYKFSDEYNWPGPPVEPHRIWTVMFVEPAVRRKRAPRHIQ